MPCVNWLLYSDFTMLPSLEHWFTQSALNLEISVVCILSWMYSKGRANQIL